MGTYKGFTTVKLKKPQRSKFDLSHEKKLSTRMGKLVPVFISETLPNDTFKCNTEVMLRLAPLLAPIYHRINCFVHFFYVPNRLLHKDWEAFITNGRLGTEVAPAPPSCLFESALDHMGGFMSKGSLWDYLGGAIMEDGTGSEYGFKLFNTMPFAAYYKVWYDYYRDRNYVADDDLLPLESGDSLGSSSNYEKLFTIKTRAWQHDYFTSALPWTQRGDEVLMPLMGSGTVEYLTRSNVIQQASGNPTNGDLTSMSVGPADGVFAVAGNAARLENIASVEIENSSVSINDLRQAVRLQEWLERNAVAGSRYNESIQAHFARRTSDGRLQRAEYLGGGRVPIQISEVMTTAWSEDGDANSVPPANMSGRGATYSKVNGFRYNCEEHGFIIGIMSVMPTSAYMQGTHRMFLHRNTFLDYPWPSFANLGEQPVYQYEVYTTASNLPAPGEEDEATLFGYQSRYADWKWIPSTAHGDFRDTLDFWHLDRKFESAPTLGNQFVSFEDALQDRIFAVSESDTLWCYVHNRVSVVRSLPYFGTPLL